MSLWGIINYAPNAKFLINDIFTFLECLEQNIYDTYNLGINELIKLYESLFNIIEFNFFEELELYQLSLPLMGNNLSLQRSRIRADKRIGPHNKIVLDIIFGSLLGDAHAERRKIGNGTRVTFYQEGVHVSYLLWLHSLFSDLQYCNSNIPVIQTRLGSKGIVRKIIRFRTWNYTSFDLIYDEWYSDGKKIIPKSIAQYLTPLVLAVWLTNNWSRNSQGLNLKTLHSYEDCLLLMTALNYNFGLETNIVSASVPSKYFISIKKKDIFVKLEHITSSTPVYKFMKHKVITQNRYFSTSTLSQSFLESKPLSQWPISSDLLNPWVITGFS